MTRVKAPLRSGKRSASDHTKPAAAKTSAARARKARSIRPGTCANCGCPETFTNLWRSDRSGGKELAPGEERPMLCNACGLWLAEKGYPRPAEQWKWQKRAMREAEAARTAAIKNGADPASVPLESFMPASHKPVMPIAQNRRESGPSEAATPTSSQMSPPQTPPASYHDTPKLHSARTSPCRASKALSPEPVVSTSFAAAHRDIDATAASTFMDMCTKFWERSSTSPDRSPSHGRPQMTPAPVMKPRSRLLEGEYQHMPSWIEGQPRSSWAAHHAHERVQEHPSRMSQRSLGVDHDYYGYRYDPYPPMRKTPTRHHPYEAPRHSSYHDERERDYRHYEQHLSPSYFSQYSYNHHQPRHFDKDRTLLLPTAPRAPPQLIRRLSNGSSSSTVILTPPATAGGFHLPPLEAFGKLQANQDRAMPAQYRRPSTFR